MVNSEAVIPDGNLIVSKLAWNRWEVAFTPPNSMSYPDYPPLRCCVTGRTKAKAMRAAERWYVDILSNGWPE